MKRGPKPQVRYFGSKGAYFCNRDGQRHKLATGPDDAPTGPTYLEALEQFKRLMSGEEVGGAIGVQPGDTLGQVVRRWVDRKPLQAKKWHQMFGLLYERFGGLKVVDLKKHHVEAWLDLHPRWNSETRHTGVRKLKAALSWTVQQGYLKSNPLASMKMPESCVQRSRGEEYALPEDLIKLLIRNAVPRFADYLLALSLTGARPAEIAHAQPMHYSREDGGKLIFRGNATKGYLHKNASKQKKGNKDRVIYLPPEVVEVIERNIANGSEYLFPSFQHGVYAAGVVSQALQRLRKKPEVMEYLKEHKIEARHVIPYALRHTYATRALAKGVSIKVLADLMGTSVQMIELHYGHLSRETQVMRKFADLING